MRLTPLPLGLLLASLSFPMLGCSGDEHPVFGGAGTSASSGSGGATGTGGDASTSSSSSAGGAGGMGTGGMGTGGMGTGGMGTGGMGTGGSGGSGGSGPVCTPEGPFDGAPVTAAPGDWTWVPVPEAKCRNGSSTGFGVRINPASDKLFIYLEGGGACFNFGSCLTNPSSYGATSFNNWKNGGGTSGIFDTADTGNAVRDWNAVYIPYCTGDIHGGDATGVDVPGIGSPNNQSFVGYANIGHDLKRIIPTFPAVTEVLLTGVSAGGFGAAYNYDRIAQAFCPVPVVLIDDSGPPMADTYVAPCLQTRWRQLWNLAATLPADCPQCTGPDGGGIVNYTTFLGAKYPSARLGLISSDEDSTISQFFGFGQNNCANIDGLAGSLPGPVYAAGLEDLRANYMMQSAAWATFFINSTTHTYLGGGGYYSTTVNGVALTDWVGAMVGPGQAGHVGP